MLEHIETKHSGEGKGRPAYESFRMKVHSRCKSALGRQLGEALNIARAGGTDAEGVLNRKDEYSRCVIPELATLEGWRGETSQKRPKTQEPSDRNPAKRMKHTETPATTASEDQGQQQQQKEGQQQQNQHQTGEGNTATRHPEEPLKDPTKDPEVKSTVKEPESLKTQEINTSVH